MKRQSGNLVIRKKEGEKENWSRREEAKQGRWEYHGVKIALDNHDKPKDERKSGREDILKKKEVIAVHNVYMRD